MSTDRIIIVGAGQAGGEIAAELRAQNYAGAITLIGDEPQLPYKRPPLSKAYLNGSLPVDQLPIRPAATYERGNIEFIGNARVTKIDRAAKRVELADGRTLEYTKLALATGTRPRPLPLKGADAPNVFGLRTLEDSDRLRGRLVAGQKLVIIGGGYIGLEVAATALKAGLTVTVLEAAPRVLARVAPPEISAYFERIHREAGVVMRTGVAIEAFEGEPEVTAIRLAGGERIACDTVLVGIGVLPNSELAQDAGLDCDNGIVVDAQARSSDPDIVAAGDCTNHPSAFLGRRVRLESVPNAMEQGRVAARTLVGVAATHGIDPPWFWSDQYELKLQMVGINSGYDQLVIRGSLDSRSFSAFYLKDGALIAADTISRPQEFGIARKLVAGKVKLTAEQLADETVPLKNLVPVPPAA